MQTTYSTLRQYLLFFSTLILSIGINYAHAFDDKEGQTDFLPVEQAYSILPELDGNQVKLQWQIADGYYLYSHQFKLKLINASGTKSELAFSVPKGKIKYDEVFEKEVEVYYHNTTLSAELPANSNGAEIELMSQGCADAGLCYPPRRQWFSINDGNIVEIPKSTIKATANSAVTVANQEMPNSDNAVADVPPSLLAILFGAIIGGMILNLMPCVFPVLSLKALSFATSGEENHRRNGWAYTVGVVASFLLVAIIITVAKSAGTNLGWGFQLQQPVFVAALVYLFALLALNLFGMFEVGTSWMGVGQKLTQGNGLSSSFFTGLLAAVVASPCTAPFMATAIGFTLTQGAAITLLVFFALGFGMALPLLVLSHSPGLAARLPRPGAWMDSLKQFLGFPLLFTCVWLLVVVGEQTSAYASALVVAGTIALAMALWLLKKQPRSAWRWLVRVFALILALSAVKLVLEVEEHGKENEARWQTYSPESLSDLRSQNKAVFLDLTADWCITCKVNERIALNIASVSEFADANGIVMMQGDWTSSDPIITELLHQFGRNGVPLYLMYPADGSKAPEVLPQILSESIVLEAMEKATK